MIHHELGVAYVLDEDGGKVTVECGNPRDAAMAAEESRAGDTMACMVEAVRDWLAWIFEAGPHPLTAVRRMVACTSRNAPWLLCGLVAKHVKALELACDEAKALKLICRSTPGEVKSSLMSAYHREGHVMAATIATVEMKLLLEDSDPEEALIRATAIEKWLARIWDYREHDQRLPRLGEAAKALYVEARALAPELILNMSGEEIAALFAQGRAAESARVKRRVNDVLTEAGCRVTTLRFQKSATACRTYAQRQKGNKNRANGAAKAHAA